MRNIIFLAICFLTTGCQNWSAFTLSVGNMIFGGCNDLPGKWLAVPGDSDFDTKDFCVMKYEAKNLDGIAFSTPNELPWVNITQKDAKAKCDSIGGGYSLISNEQWMTLASNIASVSANWSENGIGKGTLNLGHSDDAPAQALKAAADDNQACIFTGEECDHSKWDFQKRTHQLSNGEVIWDLSGNVFEWTSYSASNGKPLPVTSSGIQFPEVTDGARTLKKMLIPTKAIKPWWGDKWNSSHGIGKYYSGNEGAGGALFRGGYWYNGSAAGIFLADLGDGPDDSFIGTGFRCVAIKP